MCGMNSALPNGHRPPRPIRPPRNRSMAPTGMPDRALREVAVEKGAANILMPISSRRQLNDLPDEIAAKITIHYYLDAKDALLKALGA